jgi:diguanylate cyclase (GGDEF)-like protein/PAS domain S-box-containing protein
MDPCRHLNLGHDGPITVSMAPRLDELTDAGLDQIEQARLRATRRAERRELGTESLVAAVVLAGAGTMAATLPSTGAGPWVTLLLIAIYTALVRIEFEVGEGCTHPLQLALVPMLLLLPPGVVPLAIVAAHAAAEAPDVLRRRAPVQRMLPTVANAWYGLAPALVMAALGTPASVPGKAAVCTLALVALGISDVAGTAFRMGVGLGLDPRQELRGFAWVYLADASLAPVGFLAGLAAQREPLVLVAVLPLAGLLAVFARERRGRIENALRLHRVAQEGQDRVQSILQNSSDLVAILDADGRARTLTGRVEPIFGPGWEDAEPGTFLERVHLEDVAPLSAFLAAVASKPAGEQQEAEWRMRFADGSYRHLAGVATNLLEDERVGGLVLTARDVDDRKAFEEQLRHRAFHDALTGLANRALFYDRIEHALTRGARGDGQVAVIFVDLDDFKPVNDRHGHASGDRLLEEVARRLSSCLRSADTAARFGGDEFGILLESVDGPDAVAQTASRVLEALSQPFDLDGEPVPLTASIGMAVSAMGDRGVEELLRKADLAMYEAKRHGKCRAELYRPALERVEAGADGRGAWFSRDEEQREEIHSLLEDPGALTMVFQPLVDLRTGRVAGYESLARFNRTPVRPPNEWFAQAHRCGLGYALEARAIVAALSTPGRPGGTYLSINLSPSSLVSEEVMSVLPEDMTGLVVEVTENELVSEDPAVEAAIAALRDRGARLAVDDTGAGYAGLTHVMRLAPDIIKLDRALTTGVDTDPVKAALVASFVRYARDIDATVCAEGVETLEELQCLADLDVTYGQGFGIARPAAPWADVGPEAAAACLVSFEASLVETAGTPGRAEHDRRLERLAAQLAEVVSEGGLRACLSAIAEELHADEVSVERDDVRAAGASQLLAHDPAADPEEIAALQRAGFGSRLRVPVAYRGRIVGQLEARCREERPWSRFEIGRARMIALQLGPVLERTGAAQAPA